MKLPEKKIFFTKEGLAKLQKDYRQLTTVARQKIAQEIKGIREDGEVDENVEYTSLLAEKDRIEVQAEELKDILKNAKLIVPRKDTSTVDSGSTVIVEVENESDEFTIVGSLEADPSKGLISNESPVGKALLGAKIHQLVTVSSSLKTTYKIIAIR